MTQIYTDKERRGIRLVRQRDAAAPDWHLCSSVTSVDNNVLVWIKKKKVTQRAQRTTEIREAGKALCVFRRTNNFLFKPFEQKETKITKKWFPIKP